jgi:hypothetical protein
MSVETVIRAVRAEDFDQWRVLWAGYNAFYGREGKTALPDVVINLTWSRFFDRYEPMHAFVAERAGQLVPLHRGFDRLSSPQDGEMLRRDE